MPRILGVDIPKNKKIKISLQYLYGIGSVSAQKVLAVNNIDPERKAQSLSDDEIARLASYIQSHYKVEGELHRQVSQHIRRLMDVGCYRGVRHRRGLPVRGQRTRCNSRTRKGPRPRVGGIKRK